MTADEIVAAVEACRTQSDVASVYAAALRGDPLDHSAWLSINQAIIARWSIAGLRSIKRRAWNMELDGRQWTEIPR